MEEQDVKYFSEFLEEFRRESERGAALVGAALLDARLERVLRSHFVEGKCADELLDGGNAPLASFSSRIKCCYALGLITTHERRDLELVRAIRNAFAHQEHGLTFENNKIKGLCASLVPRRPPDMTVDSGYTPRARFTDAVIFNSMQLWYRPEHARSLKCAERAWPY